MTDKEFNIHLKYISNLLKENGIEHHISESSMKIWIYDMRDYLIFISSYIGSIQNDHYCIIVDIVSYDKILNFKFDDLSNPNAYSWLLELIKNVISTEEIIKSWGTK